MKGSNGGSGSGGSNSSSNKASSPDDEQVISAFYASCFTSAIQRMHVCLDLARCLGLLSFLLYYYVAACKYTVFFFVLKAGK